jgi:hypothetical protein
MEFGLKGLGVDKPKIPPLLVQQRQGFTALAALQQDSIPDFLQVEVTGQSKPDL